MAKEPRNTASIISDAVGLSHFLVAGIVLVLELFTDIFGEDKSGNPGVKEVFPPGIKLIYEYLDVPIFWFFKLVNYPFIKENFYWDALLIIILSSILYATLVRKLINFFSDD